MRTKKSAAQTYLEQIGAIDERIRQLEQEEAELIKVLEYKIQEKKEVLQMLDLEIAYYQGIIDQRESGKTLPNTTGQREK